MQIIIIIISSAASQHRTTKCDDHITTYVIHTCKQHTSGISSAVHPKVDSSDKRTS